MAKHASPAQLALFEAKTRGRRQRYVPTYDHYPAEALRHANEVLDQLLAQRRGLKPYEGRCLGCGKVISSKAPNCGRRTCSAVYPKWSRDQRRVTAEALREYGGLLLLTDVTLPGTPAMVALRKARRLWSAREGRCPMPDWSPAEFAAVAMVLERRPASTRAP